MVRLISVWTCVAAGGFVIGVTLPSNLMDGPSWAAVCGVSKFIVATATAALALVFKLVDTAPPKELATARQDFMQEKLNHQFRSLWVQWCFLLSAAGALELSQRILDEKAHFLSKHIAISLTVGALITGTTAGTISIWSFCRIRRTIQNLIRTLRDRKQARELLARLAG